MAINVIIPRQGQSVENCIIGELYKKKGDHVTEGEIILTFETDKAQFDLESPASGILLDMFCQTGDEVEVLSNVAIIGQPGESIEGFMPQAVSSATIRADNAPLEEKSFTDGQKTEAQNPSTAETDKIKISPRARSLASRLNIDISKVEGTGPRGKILEKDIDNAAADSQAPRPASDGLRAEKIPTTDEYTIKNISNVRRIIAEAMHLSLKNSAQLTHHTSAKVKKMLDYREAVKAGPEKAKGVNITINDMVCYAVIQALKIKPVVNSHFLGESIKTFHQVHLGIAVDTERGLMVPTLKNADAYSLSELSRELKSLADQCRNGNIDPELLSGESASFTVSNLGGYGVEMFTPVLNLPQTSILGVNTIIHRPEQSADGTITLIPYIGLSLTYDHRAIDGGPASVFLKEVKDQIEMFAII